MSTPRAMMKIPPRSIRFKTKNLFAKFGRGVKKLNGMIFKRDKDKEFSKFSKELDKKLEHLGIHPDEDERDAIEEDLRHQTGEIRGEERELNKVEEEEKKAFRDEHMLLLHSEDPLEEVRGEAMIYEMSLISGETSKLRKDPFGLKRREHMKKYEKGGKKMDQAVEEDVENLVHDLEVDQILAGVKFEYPEALMTGIKCHRVMLSMWDTAKMLREMKQDEVDEKIKTIRGEIKKYQGLAAKLKHKNDEMIELAMKFKEDPGADMKIRAKEVLLERLDQSEEELAWTEDWIRDKIGECNQEIMELKKEKERLKREEKDFESFGLRINNMKVIANSYSRTIRQLRSVGLAKTIVGDYPESEYRQKMLENLNKREADLKKEVQDYITYAFRYKKQASVFKATEEEEKTVYEVTDQQLKIITDLAAVYDHVRELREQLPKPKENETPEEKKEREERVKEIEDEADRLMNDCRYKLEQYHVD